MLIFLMFPSPHPGEEEKGVGEDESARWVEGDVDTMRTQKMYVLLGFACARSRSWAPRLVSAACLGG